MEKERIRILVDQSRNSGWVREIVNIEPDDVYKSTDNRGELNWALLKNYDVLAICGYTPTEYSEEELKLISRFVEAGGGLLLASSSSRFELVDKPFSEMGTNKIARLFGAEFLPLNSCKDETKLDDGLLRGYPRENLRFIHHPMLGELEMDDIPISNCGIISVSDNAEIFLEHSETKEPIGARLSVGKGKVILINDLRVPQDSRIVCSAFINWLAQNRLSKVEGDEEIPDEIPVDEHVKEDGKIKIYYTDLVQARVDTCLEFARKIATDMIGKFPKGPDISWEIRLNPSCDYGQHWHDPVLGVGAFMSDPRLAYALGVQMTSRMDIGESLEDILWPSFGQEAIPTYSGLMAMKLLGFKTEAEQIYDKIIKLLNEKDPTGQEFDISKAYEEHPKSVWILNTLTEKYGQDLFARFIKAIPEGKDPWEDIPYPLFTAIDVFIYYLSRGLETDLYPWFREIGTTVHPLPMHPRDSDEFKQSVSEYLRSVIRDISASTSDRSDAVWALIGMQDRKNKKTEKQEEKKPADPTTGLNSDDKYECLVSAMRLSRSSDSRSVSALEDFSLDEDDRALAAIASLALVRKGIASATDRLYETAKEQDYRFQLDAGYALQKIGYERAEELSFRGLKDENGDPVVEMKEEYDGFLKLFPTVAGQKVANIFTAPGLLDHFPGNTHNSNVYIDWVHTGSLYRRKGLARWAMEETFRHKAVRRASGATLGTGTRNTAHAMYRSFGFVDVFLSEKFTAELSRREAGIVDGLLVRPYSPGDEVKIAALANECFSLILGQRATKARRPRSNESTRIAEKDGEMVGYARASTGRNKEEAGLHEIWVKKVDNRDDIGAALLCALHNELHSRGIKKISMGRENILELSYIRNLLLSFGYSHQPRTGGVDMYKIINLPMLLEELSPLLSKCLNESNHKHWRGRIGIIGKQHRASIVVDDNGVSVSEEVPEDVDLLLSTDDDTLTRIIFGRITPFEAYLQIQLTIKPMVNHSVAELLETIFPRIPDEG